MLASLRTVVPRVAQRYAVRGMASVGDKLPAVNLHFGFPPEMINLAEYSADKSLVLVGLPGAFTPTVRGVWSIE